MNKIKKVKVAKVVTKQQEVEQFYNTYRIHEFHIPGNDFVQRTQVNPGALITRFSNSSKPLPDIK